MRLPFGLGRRSSSGDGASGGGASTGSVAAPARAAAAPSRAWASLPPIQRTTSDMPLVAAPGSFAEALPGSRALPPIVQPLGHEVSALATPGLVVAHARPVPVAALGSIPAPVQRRAARGGSRSAAVAASAAAAPEPEAVEHAHDVSAGAGAPVPAPAPVRTMPTVSRSAVRVPDRPLTSAASAARPAAVQRAAAAAAAANPSSPAPLPPVASGGMRRVPAASSTTAPTLSRQASSSTADPAATSAAPAAKPSRAGLGEPLASLPASARPIAAPGPVVSRSTTAGPMPISAAGLRAPVQPSASAASASAPLPALGPGVVPPGATPAPRLPELPVLPVARASGVTRPSAATGPSFAEPAPTVMRTTASEPAPLIRPIAGANPIRTAFSIQREADDDLEEASDDDSALPSPWWAPVAAPAAHPLLGDGADASGLASTVQRSVAAGGSASSFGGEGRSAALRSPATETQVQRVAATPRLPALTLPRDPGHRASDAGRPNSTGPTSSGPVVQTSPAASSGGARIVSAPGSGLVVQREGTVPLAAQEPTAPAAPGTSTNPAGPAGPTSPAGPPAPGGQGRSERDLDELAQALFGRIRGRLRSDLIYDREAKGLTFDNV